MTQALQTAPPGKGLVTAQDIAAATGRHKSSIIRRAEKEGWPFEVVPVRGGNRRDYLPEGLPEDARVALAKKQGPRLRPSGYAGQGGEQGAGSNGQVSLSQGQINTALAKADLLRLYTGRLKKAKWGNKKQIRRDFMRAYNSGIAYPQIFEVLDTVDWKTIEGWKRTIKSGGDILELADRRGFSKRGVRGIGPEQTDILLRCALHPNKPLISEVIRMARAIMQTQNIQDGNSDATYRRWLDDWIGHHHDIWTFSRKGAKAWNDDCAYSIERDYSVIQVGDILVADGHVLNFEILNPWTGKPKRMTMIVWKDMKSNFPLGWEIMPTENTQAIASALRWAILRLEKIPQIAYLDNGKAFGAKYFQGVDFDQAGFAGLFERLGIKTIFAWSYHGQSKTVERFFGTFAELERWCPTYTGTSIEHKPPRMMRGEKLHRRIYDRLTEGKCITLEQAHRAIATWFDTYVQRPQQGHLDGAAPIEIFLEGKGPGVDPVQLRYLMLSEENRIIRRNGVPWMGKNYYAPELYGRRHPVTIRYDIQDTASVLVFDDNGKFLCEAFETEKVHPAASILGTEEDRERLAEQIELKRHQEKETSASARVFLEQHILPVQRKMLEGVEPEVGGQRSEVRGQGKVVKLTTLEEKRVEAQAEETLRLTRERMPELETDYVPDLALVEASTDLWTRVDQMTDKERFRKLIELEVRGWVLPKVEKAWMRYYEMTPEYTAHQALFAEYRANVMVFWRRAANI